MITSAEIRDAEIARSARGYKINEVDDLLEDAALSLEQKEKENIELRRKLEVLADKIQEYRDEEDSIRSALLTAQRAADNITKEAAESKEKMTGEAKANAEAILTAAKQKAEAALTTAQEKAIKVVDETRERSSAILSEARQKAERMVNEATVGCQKEHQLYEAIKQHNADFRSALMNMYRQQLELLQKNAEELRDLNANAPQPSVPAEKIPFSAEPSELSSVSHAAEQKPDVKFDSDIAEEAAAPITGGFSVNTDAKDAHEDDIIGGGKFNDVKFDEDFDISSNSDEKEDESAAHGFFSHKK